MDGRREFTLRLLAKAGGEKAGARGAGPASVRPPAPPPGPGGRVLVAAEGGLFWALPALREAVSLRRFGYGVEVLAEEALLAALGRQIPPECPRRTEPPQETGTQPPPLAVVAAASPGLLAKLAMGLWDGPAATAVLWALWHGLPAYLDFSCAEKDPEGQPCQSTELHALYKGYAAATRKMGLRHYERGSLLEAVRALEGETRGKAPTCPGGEPAPAGRVFITLRDVQQHAGETEWPLPPGAVVTAAARDEAGRRKIVFK